MAPESVQIIASPQTSEPVQPVRVPEVVKGPALEEVVLSVSNSDPLPMLLLDLSPVSVTPLMSSLLSDADEDLGLVDANNSQFDLAGSHKLLDTVFANKAFDNNAETDPDLADADRTAQADLIDVF